MNHSPQILDDESPPLSYQWLLDEVSKHCMGGPWGMYPNGFTERNVREMIEMAYEMGREDTEEDDRERERERQLRQEQADADWEYAGERD